MSASPVRGAVHLSPPPPLRPRSVPAARPPLFHWKPVAAAAAVGLLLVVAVVAWAARHHRRAAADADSTAAPPVRERAAPAKTTAAPSPFVPVLKGVAVAAVNGVPSRPVAAASVAPLAVPEPIAPPPETRMAAVAAAEPDGAVCRKFGTSVDFDPNPTHAAKRAAETEKLLLVLHVSGNFEDSGFT